MSAFDPKRTLHGPLTPFQWPRLSLYDLVLLNLLAAMRRRDFITLFGSAAVWRPITAGAQQSPVPVIGLLGSSSSDKSVHMTRALRMGLNESGFIDGKDLAIEYRWAHDNYDSFPGLVADFVKRQVASIVTVGAEPSALAAKAATNKIPIVFVINGDPVSIGLVNSINRPGGNATGMSLMSSALEAKRLELLSELIPKGTKIAILVNPDYPDTDFQLGSVETAASNIGQKVHGGQIILPAKAACRNSWTLRGNRWPVYRMPIRSGSLSRLRGCFTRCSRIEERICDVDHREDQVVHTARRLSEHDGAQER